ncbi:MAG TPA: VRR-NUC domain-containing protein [Steroidobacteraceae bacterium]
MRAIAGNRAALDQFYYLKNFETVLDSLRERYADLLSAEEHGFMERFRAMPQASRALLVRMVMRKGELFRASALRYAEIGATHAVAAPLAQAGWVDVEPHLTLEELQALLTKAELVRHFALPGRELQRKKSDLAALLRQQYSQAKPFLDWCPGSGERVYRLTVAALCERFRLMFFGNFRQDWSAFVLADLGIFSFEKIDLAVQSRAFRSREDVDVLLQLQRCREYLNSTTPLDTVVRSVPEEVRDCDWLEERRQKLLFDVARALERSGDTLAACAIYSRCTHSGAHERGVRLYRREQRKLGIRCAATPRATRNPPELPSFELVLDQPVPGCAIEYLARNHLAQDMPHGATVHYVENSLINSLFGLLCWRAIFAPIAGAFFHDFHRGPADLSSADFYRRREREFAGCFAELESGRYQMTIRETYTRKVGIQSPFVAWNLLSESLLAHALACLPPEHLRHWFEWIARDVPRNRAGFPDLIQLWPRERRYRMIEVKAPGDRLQDNQRRLLQFCAGHGMPVAVCYVRWARPNVAQS